MFSLDGKVARHGDGEIHVSTSGKAMTIEGRSMMKKNHLNPSDVTVDMCCEKPWKTGTELSSLNQHAHDLSIVFSAIWLYNQWLIIGAIITIAPLTNVTL